MKIRTVKGIITRPAVKVAVMDARGPNVPNEETNNSATLFFHSTTSNIERKLSVPDVSNFTPVKKVLELPKLDISQPESINRQAENNFTLWGKRRKLDIEHIKSLRDKFEKNGAKRLKFTPTRIRPWSAQTIDMFNI